LEAATQIVESRIVQKGFIAASYPFDVHTNYNGSGTAMLGASPNEVSLAIDFVKSGANDAVTIMAIWLIAKSIQQCTPEKPWEMKTPKKMALSTNLGPTKPSSRYFGKQPDRHALILCTRYLITDDQ